MMPHLLMERLSGYLDDAVADEERREVEAHLTECAACRDILAALRQTAALVRGLDPVPAPEGFRARVRARLLDERGPAAPMPFAAVRAWLLTVRPPTWRTALAGAAVVLVGLFSLNLIGQFVPARPDREEEFAARDAAAPASRGAIEGGERLNQPSVTGVQPVGTAAPQAQAPAAPGLPRLPLERQIVRSAALGVEVVSFEDGSKALARIVEAAGGFIADSSVSPEEPPQGAFVLRVPAFRFLETLERVEALGKVSGRQVRGEDVTEEFVDLRARIRNLEHHERQLVTFMDRATRVTDLLAIEQELSRVRGEIEQLTGRLRFLGNRIQLSTIQVTLREKGKQGGAIFWDFGASMTKVQAAFLGTIRQVLAGAERLAIVASALVPLVVLGGAGWWVIRRLVRRGAGAL